MPNNAACARAWRHGPDGKPTGLVLADVQAAMQMLGVKDTADCLMRVQIMEAEVLRCWG